MNQELLSFAIETLLMKPRPQVGPTMPGWPIVATPQSSNCDVVRENAEAMRDLIVERLTSNAKAVADAIMSIIKIHAQMQPDAVFELCDEVVGSYWPVPTYRANPFDPKLGNALEAILSYCNYSFTPPAMNPSMMYNNPPTNPSAVYPNQSKDASTPYNGQYNDAMMSYVSQAQGLVNGLKMNVEAFIQTMLSSKMYSPSMELRNCNEKVVIIHDCAIKDELRSIADEKNMIVLTATTENDPIRPELGLLLMINAYYSPTGGARARLFPGCRKYRDIAPATHEWTSVDNYTIIDRYICTTDEVRDELKRKAPDFFSDFNEDIAEMNADSAQ